MARTIKTVKATGGDYTSLKAALEAVGNITAYDTETIHGKPIALEIQVFASAKNDPNMAVAIYGTLNSTHWLRIVAPAGECHAGVWDTNKWYLDCPTASYYGVQVAQDYVMLEGLQVNASGTNGIGLYLGGNCLVLNTLAKGTGRPCNITGGTIDFNNVIFDGGSTYNQQTAGTITLAHCLVTNNAAYGWVINGGACTTKNTYLGGNAVDLLPAGAFSYVTSACKDNETRTGLTGNVAFSTANFISVTPGNADYLKPLVGGALDGTGTDLSADGNWWLDDVDIAGAARATWDIGPFAAGTGGGGGGTSTLPLGRIVTGDTFRLLTTPTDIFGGPDDPTGGNPGDAFLKGTGGLWVNHGGTWTNYTPVWKRTGTLLEPVGLTDALTLPGALTLGANLLPSTGYVSNIGSLAKKFLALHAAELWVETLVAQNTIATIGGRILVGPTNPLTADLAAAATSITVKYNNFANGDRVYLEANGNVEWLAITSAVGGTAGAYTYSVTRNLDGSGANDWSAGDAVFSTGTTGAGYIDLYSARSLRSASQLGPSIVGNVRTGTTYSDLSERWAIGNLDGLYGYSGATYGAAFGVPTGAWVKIDPTNGIRIGHNATTKIELTAAGVAKLIGIEAMSVLLGSSGYIRQGQTAYDTGGAGFWLGDVSGTAKFSLGNSAGKKLLWDGTNFVIVAPDITLGEATSSYQSAAAIKFAKSASFGGGTGDRLGIHAITDVNYRHIIIENTAVPTGGTGEFDSRISLVCTGWYSTAALTPAAFTLRNDIDVGNPISGEAVLEGANFRVASPGSVIVEAGRVEASYPVMRGIQTYTISADQNNFSISANKYILKVTNTSGAVRYFNGFSAAGATPEDGRILVISNCNASNQYIYLQHDNAGSTAAYRIYTRRQAVVEIRANEAVTLRYDAADSRWVTI